MQTITLQTWGRSSDITGLCDRYIAQYGRVYLLSLVGNDSAVKALASKILEKTKSYEGLYLEDKTFVSRNKDVNYRSISQKLGSGQIHTLIADNRFWEPTKEKPDEHVLFMEPDEKAPDIVFNQVLRSTATPLLSEWRSWIYDEMVRANQAQTWAGYNCNMVEVKVNEEILDELVSRGVKEGALTWQH